MRGFVLCFLLLAAGCGETNGPGSRTPQLSLVSGAGQTDTVKQELPQLIAVSVTDKATAAPMANYPINWVALNGGTVFAPVTPSGSDGMARQRVTLGTAAGVQCFAARALDPNTGDILQNEVICETATPDTAYSIHAAQADVAVSVGDSVAVRWWYADVYGNAGAHCRPGYNDADAWSASGGVSLRVSNDTLWIRGVTQGSGGAGADASCLAGGPPDGIRNRAVVRVTVQ